MSTIQTSDAPVASDYIGNASRWVENKVSPITSRISDITTKHPGLETGAVAGLGGFAGWNLADKVIPDAGFGSKTTLALLGAAAGVLLNHGARLQSKAAPGKPLLNADPIYKTKDIADLDRAYKDAMVRKALSAYQKQTAAEW